MVWVSIGAGTELGGMLSQEELFRPGFRLRRGRSSSRSNSRIKLSEAYGAPLLAARRMRSCSSAGRPSASQALQSSCGADSGISDSSGSHLWPQWAAALDHWYFLARLTMPARTGFRSTYRTACQKCELSRTHAKNRSCRVKFPGTQLWAGGPPELC